MSEWRDISTAPKDGRFIDVWMPARPQHCGYRITNTYWSDIEEWWCEGDDCPLTVYPKPSHWMPLPEPPTTGE